MRNTIPDIEASATGTSCIAGEHYRWITKLGNRTLNGLIARDAGSATLDIGKLLRVKRNNTGLAQDQFFIELKGFLFHLYKWFSER